MIHPTGSSQSVVQVNTVFEPTAIQGIRFAAGKQQFVPEVTYPPTQPETDKTLGKQTREGEKQPTLECFCSYAIIHDVLFASFEAKGNPGKREKYKLCFIRFKGKK